MSLRDRRNCLVLTMNVMVASRIILLRNLYANLNADMPLMSARGGMSWEKSLGLLCNVNSSQFARKERTEPP